MTKCFLLLASLFITNLYAQVELPGTDQNPMGPCKQDIAALCSTGIAPTREGIRECLKMNKDKLSAECKADIAEFKGKMKEKRKEMKETCKADVEKFCATIEKGEGRIIKCLKENKDKEGFGADCKKELEEMKKHKRKWKD